jgi:SAM-dependent methyltransferase
MVPDPTYFAAAADTQAETERLNWLEAVYDPGTIELLTATGVGPGWGCLVPGAGHGNIARWLANRVAPDGHVVATDIDTQFLEQSASEDLEVRRQDLLDTPLESDTYDLATTRCLLVHLVGKQQEAIDSLVGAVHIGGWLVIDEGDADTIASADPSHPAHEVVGDALRLVLSAISEHLDLLGGRHLASLLMRHPALRVEDIDVSATVESGGSPFAKYCVETIGLVLPALMHAGAVSQESAQVVTEAFADPSFQFLTTMRYRILAQRVDTNRST